MAYNQEYPNFLDTQLYNNDWLLHQYKGLTEDVSNLKTESTQNAADIAALQTITASNTTRIAALEQGGGGGEPSDLTERVETLEGEVEDLKADMSEAQTDISSIKQEQIVQDTVSADLRADITKMSVTLSAFTATVIAQGQAITSLQEAQASQDTVNTELNERIADLENGGAGGEQRELLYTWLSISNDTVIPVDSLDDYEAFVLYYRENTKAPEKSIRVDVKPNGSMLGTWICVINSARPISTLEVNPLPTRLTPIQRYFGRADANTIKITDCVVWTTFTSCSIGNSGELFPTRLYGIKGAT